MFGMFFFLTIFMQEVWGYSALKCGLAYLPMVAWMVVVSGVASQLVSRIGARPLMIAGAAILTGGMFWLSRITEHSTYVSGVLGPLMVVATGIALIFMPVSLVSLAKVADNDTGVAGSLLTTAQQVGGAVGLAVLGTVAWSAVAGNLRTQAAALKGSASAAAQVAMSHHALVFGFSRGFLVSAGAALLALIITVAMIRVTREDLAGIKPMAAPTD
jgi:predicted MFS family arabinose efflux permease